MKAWARSGQSLGIAVKQVGVRKTSKQNKHSSKQKSGRRSLGRLGGLGIQWERNKMKESVGLRHVGSGLSYARGAHEGHTSSDQGRPGPAKGRKGLHRTGQALDRRQHRGDSAIAKPCQALGMALAFLGSVVVEEKERLGSWPDLLLPMSMLALRVTKVDPHEGHNHAPPKKAKRQKGLWTVRVEPQQEAGDDMYYVWLYEGSQIMRKVYAALAWFWGFLGLLGLFFLMAIFRVILFCVTYFVVPPGLWLYPNLWEDVSFMDSFRPVWAWHETTKPKKKKKKTTLNTESAAHFAGSIGEPTPATATTTATETQVQTAPQQRSYVAPRVEELGDDE
ncbi:hypothetical protein NUW58_g6736 [Xylaria curta]|uniref:Uncharacterized protein n=1 Tax=Xylaria curta TaxID=42375 RepID=A0ACC1NPM7_9PEZI|nr:hypothetical protein NUW58_g6736 [Xylaria curta]